MFRCDQLAARGTQMLFQTEFGMRFESGKAHPWEMTLSSENTEEIFINSKYVHTLLSPILRKEFETQRRKHVIQHLRSPLPPRGPPAGCATTTVLS